MRISKRDFLKHCGASASALSLSATDLANTEEASAVTNGSMCSPSSPTVFLC